MQTQQRRKTSVVLFSIALLIGSLFVAPAANAAVATPASFDVNCSSIGLGTTWMERVSRGQFARTRTGTGTNLVVMRVAAGE